MRSYAVIPPLMFDNRQRRLVFHNENGSKVDMETELSAYKTVNLWTTGEKETFRDKYIQQAKNFGFIASHLERKSPQVRLTRACGCQATGFKRSFSCRIVFGITTSVKRM